MKSLTKLALFLAIAAVAFTGTAGYLLNDWSQEWREFDQPIVFEVSRGTTLADLSFELESKGVIDSSLLFRALVKVRGSYKTFQAGIYEFKGRLSPNDVIQKIREGKTYQPIVLKFTIPEGFTADKIFNRLAKLGVSSKKKLVEVASSKDFLRKHNLPGKSVEGFLYPATYHFRRKPGAYEVLSHLVNTFWQKLPSGYVERAEEKGLNLTEAVTFASLIELETKFEDEKSKVSEVIWRRLKMGSPLGIDASLIYGIKDYDGDIKWKHLKDKTNPYNSRIHKGLPPTPIASPDIKSLLAVLSPTNKGYTYYVVNASSKQGRHHFSRTQEEHNRYVRKLVKSGHGR